MAVGEEFDVTVGSCALHAERWGSPSGSLVLGLPGLTGNVKNLAFLGERLGSDTLQLVALDLRGRGRSDVTPPGTYGWESLVNPWTRYWDEAYRYDLTEVDGGVQPRTTLHAVREDRAYTATEDPYDRWTYLTMPSLLLRATQELRAGAGFVVPAHRGRRQPPHDQHAHRHRSRDPQLPRRHGVMAPAVVSGGRRGPTPNLCPPTHRGGPWRQRGAHSRAG